MKPYLPLFLITLTAACGPSPRAAVGSLPAASAASTAAPLSSRSAPPPVAVEARAVEPAAVAPTVAPALPAASQEELDLLTTVETDPDPAARRRAVDALAARGSDPQALARTLFSEQDPVVRRWTALALDRMGGAEAADVVRQALTLEQDPRVRGVLERVVARAP
jgi:HEAT repeat protein